MKKIDAKKNNPIIAEFMDQEVFGIFETGGNPLRATYPASQIEEYRKKGYKEQLSYHSSYDWLMPVVDKIESLGNGMQTKLQKDMNGDFTFGIIWYAHYSPNEKWYPSRIEAIYSAVLDFIKYYNDDRFKK